MDLDLDRASQRRKREEEAKRRAARQKLDEKRKNEAAAVALEEKYKAEAAAAADRAVAEAVARDAERAAAEARTGGIDFRADLRPMPIVRLDDKLHLPPSALQAFEQQGALASGPLVFEVRGAGLETATLAGVAEFIADEGTVGVPPKVAHALARQGWTGGPVAVEYVRLPVVPKAECTLQPLGDGFHVLSDIVKVDAQALLQRSLRSYTALAVDDVISVRHQGRTVRIRVTAMKPKSRVCVAETDVSVDLGPAENVAREQQRTERRAARAAAAEARWVARLAACPPEVPGTKITLRGHPGLQRSFSTDAAWAVVLEWARAATRQEGAVLVQSWPGFRKVLGDDESAASIAALGLGPSEALHVEAAAAAAPAEEVSEDEAPFAGAPLPEGEGADSWREAAEAALVRLDAADAAEGAETAEVLTEAKSEERIRVLHALIAFGMPAAEAGKFAHRWGSQLTELEAMGFDVTPRAAELCEKYQGRLVRVVNALSEDAAPAGSAPAAPAPAAPAPGGASTDGSSSPASGGASSGGASSGGASSGAEAPAAAAAAEAPAEAPEAPMEVDGPPAEPQPAQNPGGCTPEDAWPGLLAELASMGFADEARNRALLAKYSGRVDRVVAALCE